MASSIRVTPWHRSRLLIALLAAQGLATLAVLGYVVFFFPALTMDRVEFLVRCSVGIAFSQATLLGAWNALGDGRAGLRPMGSLLCLLCAWGMAYLPSPWFQPYLEFGPLGLALFVQWIFIQLPFWFFRLKFGWQLGQIDGQNAAGGLGDVQFGIRHLVAWTTLVAIALGLAKSFVQESSGSPGSFAPYFLFLLCNSLFAWPMVLSCMADRWMPAALLATIMFTIVVTWAEPWIFAATLGTDSHIPHIFLWLNGIQFVWVVGSLLLLRRVGYRLVKPR
jgi:hypothetical protein